MSNLFRDNLYSEFPDPNKKIEELGDNLSTLQSKQTSMLGMLEFEALKVAVAGGYDYAPCVQKAIDTLNPRTDSTLSFSDNRGGVVKIPSGVFMMSRIVMKSNVSVQGVGTNATIIKPLGTSGYVLDVQGTSHDTDGVKRIANVSISDLSIQPTIGFYSVSPNRPTVGGINLSYTTSLKIERVVIANLDGIGINNKENYDCNMNDVQILACKTGFASFSDIDTTNAIHVSGMRIEMCETSMEFRGSNSQSVREMQFVACKIEGGGIKLVGVNSLNFVGTHFTYFDNTKPMIDCTEVTTIENVGLKFTGCSFLTSEGVPAWFFNSTKASSIQLTGCNFYNAERAIVGTGFNIVGGEFYKCKAPVIDVNESVVNGVQIKATRGNNGDYIIKLNSACKMIGGEIRYNTNTSLNGVQFIGSDNIVGENTIGEANTAFDFGATTGNTVKTNRLLGLTTATVGTGQYLANNHYERAGAMKVPHTAFTNEGGINFDVNEKRLKIYDATQLLDVPLARSGTTANRPTIGLYVGMPYFDTTLGKQIHYKGSTVWVDGTGTAV